MAHDAADLSLTFGAMEIGMVVAVLYVGSGLLHRTTLLINLSLTGVATLQAWNVRTSVHSPVPFTAWARAVLP